MKKRAGFLPLVAVICGIFAMTTYAHHSVVALYDQTKTIKIEGRLLSFSFRSPHSVVIVEAPDSAGTMQRWDVAWNAAAQLSAQGITRESFKPGDKVIITGNPGRDVNAHIIRMVTFLRPSDGLAWGNREGETFK
jgi:hypothetical protein